MTLDAGWPFKLAIRLSPSLPSRATPISPFDRKFLTRAYMPRASGVQIPITAFFHSTASQHSSGKRRRDASTVVSDGVPNKKKAKGKEPYPVNYAADATVLVASGPSKSHDTVSQGKQSPPLTGRPAGVAKPSATPSSSSLTVEGSDAISVANLTTSNTPPHSRLPGKSSSYLPTPAASVRRRPGHSSPGKSVWVQPSGVFAGTPAIPIPIPPNQLPTPATPTRLRARGVPLRESSPLSSLPPSSPTLRGPQHDRDSSNSHALAEDPFLSSRGAILPSSIQLLDHNPFVTADISPLSSPSNGRFKLPALPEHFKDSALLLLTPGSVHEKESSNNDDTYIIPSSQSQDLSAYFAKGSSPSPRSGRSCGPSSPRNSRKEGNVPSSQIFENDFLTWSPASSRRRQDTLFLPTTSSVEDRLVQDDADEQITSAQGDFVPTSQMETEKELSSSDFLKVRCVWDDDLESWEHGQRLKE